MKTFLIVAVALALSGCADTNFYGERDNDEPVTPVAEAAPPPSSPHEVAAEVPPPPPPQEAMPAPADDTSAAPPPVSQDQPPVVAVVETTKLPPNAHCKALANQRAQDAAFQGEDPDTQESVHDRTYAECVAWDLKHAFR